MLKQRVPVDLEGLLLGERALPKLLGGLASPEAVVGGVAMLSTKVAGYVR